MARASALPTSAAVPLGDDLIANGAAETAVDAARQRIREPRCGELSGRVAYAGGARAVSGRAIDAHALRCAVDRQIDRTGDDEHDLDRAPFGGRGDGPRAVLGVRSEADDVVRSAEREASGIGRAGHVLAAVFVKVGVPGLRRASAGREREARGHAEPCESMHHLAPSWGLACACSQNVLWTVTGAP